MANAPEEGLEVSYAHVTPFEPETCSLVAFSPARHHRGQLTEVLLKKKAVK